MTAESTKRVFAMSDATYDFFNRVVKYVLPGLGTFYFTIAQIWNLPYGEQVVGSIVALATLLGIILAISKKSYNNQPFPFDGDIVVSNGQSGDPALSLESNISIEELQNKDAVVMKVIQED